MTSTIKRAPAVVLATALVAMSLFAALAASQAQAALRHFDGTVIGKNADAKTNLQKYLELDPNGKDASTAKEMLKYVK